MSLTTLNLSSVTTPDLTSVTPCPPWCVDCWKGSDDPADPDPGVVFHHGSEHDLVWTNGPETHKVRVSLERLDRDGEPGETQIFIHTPEAAYSMRLDEASGTALALLSLIRDGQGGAR